MKRGRSGELGRSGETRKKRSSKLGEQRAYLKKRYEEAFGYDNRSRPISTTDVFGHTINYEFERTSLVNQKRLEFDGAMYAVYKFDDAERLTNIVNSSESTTTTFGYDNEDKVTSRTYPNGVTTSYQYFDNDLLKCITDANSSTTLFDRQYLYDSARQISTDNPDNKNERS